MKRIRSTVGMFCEICVFFHHKTDQAILVSKTGQEKDSFWIPLSLCENEPEIVFDGEHAEVELTVPEWVAIKHGFE